MKTDDKNMEIQILEAAEKLFLDQGFIKTTTGQIAKLAGCNQALVHYYYRTKDNLFDKVFEEKIRLLTSNILLVDTTGTNLEEGITKMVGMHFDFLKQNPKLIPFVLNEIISNPDRVYTLVGRMQQYPKSIFAKLDADLKKEVEKGTIHPISAIDLLFTIASLNVTPFLVMPILQKALDMSDVDMNEALEHRKKEVVNIILSRLRK